MPRWLVVVLIAVGVWVLLRAVGLDPGGAAGAAVLIAVVFLAVALCERAPERRR